MKRGDIVALEFDDHCSGADELVRFVAYGKVAKVTRASVTIDCWHYADESETDRGENVDRYTIARKTIKSAKVLREL